MTASTHRQSPRRVDRPEPGYFRMPLCRGGWPVACRIVYEDGLWGAVINGEVYAPHTDPWRAARLSDVWHHGTHIDAAEYSWRLAQRYIAGHPAADPTRAVDVRRLQPYPPQRRTP